jgi:hypothetical protein
MLRRQQRAGTHDYGVAYAEPEDCIVENNIFVESDSVLSDDGLQR